MPPGTNPVIIGGTGGSGTRCLAEIMVKADAYLGWDLNQSYDSLSLTPFLRRHMLEANNHFENLSTDQVDRWEADFVSAISKHLLKYTGQPVWGWKNPTSIFLVPFFNHVFPRMKFIHIVRDGRDMALSQNSNQYISINAGGGSIDYEEKAQFWSVTNVRARDYARNNFDDNYLLVRFEDLCNDPRRQIKDILEFVGSSAAIDSCVQAVRSPASIGRYQALPRREIQRLTEAAENGLTEFGYA